MNNISEEFRILIVEDSEPTQHLIMHHLKAKGFSKFHLADNGIEAKEILSHSIANDQKFSLIVLDINMPEMNGIEFLRTIKDKEAFANIPVLVISAEDDKRTIMEVLNLGADQYIIKPYTETLLAEKLNKILET